MVDLPSILRGWWDNMDAQARAQAAEYAAKSPGEIGMEFAREAAPYAVGAAVGPALGAAGRAVPSLGNVLRSFATRAPITAGALEGGATGGAIYGAEQALAPSGAVAQSPEEVRQLQIELKNKGYYSGKIDGNMGEATKAAKKAFEADEAAKATRDLQRQGVEAETERAKAEGARAAAETQKAQTEAKRLETEEADRVRKAQQRDEGQAKLKRMEEEMSWPSYILQKSGPAAGAVLGGMAGLLTKRGMVGHYNTASKGVAKRADDLMKGIDDMPIEGQAARVNQFYGEGQPRPLPFRDEPQIPFTPTGGRPPFRSNSAAPGASELYQPDRVVNAGKDLGVAGLFGAESLASDYFVGNRARAEKTAAEEAAAADPSDINLQRLMTARNNASLADVLSNFGRLGGLTYFGSGMKYGRNPERPNVSAAEQKRFEIDKQLASPPALPPAPPPPPAPAPAPAAATWQNQPRGATRGKPGTNAGSWKKKS